MSCSGPGLILIRGTDLVFTIEMLAATDLRATHTLEVAFRDRELAAVDPVAMPSVRWVDGLRQADGNWKLSVECRLTAAETGALTQGRNLFWKADLVGDQTRERIVQGEVEVRE